MPTVEFTTTVVNDPNYSVTATATDMAVGNKDVTIPYRNLNNGRGFSITTGTLTAVTITILVDNGNGNAIDITTDLTGAAALSSNSAYLVDITVPVYKVIIRAVRTNASNALAYCLFAAAR